MIKDLPISSSSKVVITKFISYLKAKGYQRSESYALGVIEFIHQIEQKSIDLEAVDSEVMKTHYEYLLSRPNRRTSGALSESTVNGYLFSLRLFFNYLYQLGALQTDPMSVLSFGRSAVTPRVILSNTEINLLYGVCQTFQESAILSLFYGCGLRRMEGEQLNIRDVDFKSNWLYVRRGKGKKRRVIPMTKRIRSDLSNYYYEERPKQINKETKGKDRLSFMLNCRGRRMRGNTYWKTFKSILKRSGINKEVSLHHLRHSVATHLLASGLSVEMVRYFLGHEFIETTQIYTRVDLSKYAL